MVTNQLRYDTMSFDNLSEESLFLVWGPPSHGPRSRVFARKLGIEELHFIYSTTRRGLLAAPYKYSYQAINTLSLLFRLRPKIVFIQSPPSFAVFFVFIYCLITNSQYVIDAHSGALLTPYWIRPAWLHRFLARKAVTTIVTNEHFQKMIQEWGGQAFIIRDIPTSYPMDGSYPVNGDFNILVVNTFADDEPLENILVAAEKLSGVHLNITGKVNHNGNRLTTSPPDNVTFTDFLPDDDYFGLMNNSQAVMCLTTRNHTMQRGACEALSMGKPIVTSDWPLLQDYFNKGTVHVDNSAIGIQQGIEEMVKNFNHYQAGIFDLKKDQLKEWGMKIKLLKNLIEQSREDKNENL